MSINQYSFYFLIWTVISPLYLFQKVTSPQLLGYRGLIVKQAPFPDNKLLLMINDQTIVYDSKGDTPLHWPITSQINQNKSSIMKRVLNGQYAMVCGSKHLTLFNENGIIINEYTGKTSYLTAPDLCSLTEIKRNQFLICYIGPLSIYNIEKVQYDQLTNSFTQMQTKILPQFTNKLVCEVFTSIQLLLCTYIKGPPGLYGQLMTYSLTTQGTEIPISNMNDILFHEIIRLNDNEVILVFALLKFIYAKKLIYKDNTLEQGVEKYVAGNTREFNFQYISIAKLTNDIFVGCFNSLSFLLIQKFYNDLELNGDLMEFLVVDNSQYLKSNSLGIFQLNFFSIILTKQNQENWRIFITFPVCHDGEYKAITGQVLDDFTELGDSTTTNKWILINKQYPITISQSDLKQKLNSFHLTFLKGGVYTYRFVIIEEVNFMARLTQVHSLDCTLIVNVCFKLCATCSAYGNQTDHQCLTCINGYHPNPEKTTDCIEGCDPNNKYYHNTITNSDVCLPGDTCSDVNYSYEVEGSNECVHDCKPKYTLNILLKICICVPPLVINQISKDCVTLDELIEDINKRINNNLDDNILGLLENYPLWNQDNSTFTVYENTPEGRDKISGSNLSSIECDDCERILKKAYQIPDDEPLVIVKFDSNDDRQLTNVVTYHIYTPSGMKLDTSLCDEILINITTPIIDPKDDYFDSIRQYANKSIDLFDSSEAFFNDICFVDLLNNNTDITLENRRALYNNGSLLCNQECQLVDVNLTSNNAVCKCKTNTKSNIEWHQLALTNIIPDSNIELAKCYQLVFKVTNLYRNIGCIIYIMIIITEIGLLIAYCTSQSSSLMIYLSHIHNETMKFNSQKQLISIIKERHEDVSSERNHLNQIMGTNVIKQLPFELITTLKINKTNQTSDHRLNNMPYSETLVHDNRNFLAFFCFYFNVFFRLYNTFTHDKFTSNLIKVSLCIFCISSDLFFNVLLFTDNYISVNYHSEGRLNFNYNIPRALYACLASSSLKLPIQLLPSLPLEVLSLSIKTCSPKQLLVISKKILRNNNIQISIYIIIQFILLIGFWYYTTAFCIVYKNNQLNWIVISLMTIVFNIGLSVLMAIIVSALRLTSIKYKSETIYNFIQIVRYLN